MAVEAVIEESFAIEFERAAPPCVGSVSCSLMDASWAIDLGFAVRAAFLRPWAVLHCFMDDIAHGGELYLWGYQSVKRLPVSA